MVGSNKFNNFNKKDLYNIYKKFFNIVILFIRIKILTIYVRLPINRKIFI